MQEILVRGSAELDGAELSLGNLSINLDTCSVCVDNETIELTYNEYEILRLFCARANQVVSYTALSRALWSQSGPQEIKHLNVIVHRLRTKLARSRPFLIQTVRGRG